MDENDHVIDSSRNNNYISKYQAANVEETYDELYNIGASKEDNTKRPFSPPVK